MSLRHYYATALDCDQCGDSCIDAVEVRDDLLVLFAIRDGWMVDEAGNHYCPECRPPSANAPDGLHSR
jgi:hypothetical protein